MVATLPHPVKVFSMEYVCLKKFIIKLMGHGSEEAYFYFILVRRAYVFKFHLPHISSTLSSHRNSFAEILL